MKGSTVYDIIKRFNKENRLESHLQSRRHHKLSRREEIFLRKIKKNPKLSAPKIAAVHPETIRVILRKAEFHGRVARRKPFKNKIIKRKRRSSLRNI